MSQIISAYNKKQAEKNKPGIDLSSDASSDKKITKEISPDKKITKAWG